MSHQLIDRSPELKKLRDEGFNVSVVAGHLVVDDIPYVTSNREVKVGKLVTDLKVNGDEVSGMGSHVAHFIGEYPCDQNGALLARIKHPGNSGRQNLAPGLTTDHSFSARPTDAQGRKGSYNDYYHKMTTYTWLIAGPALEINPSMDPRTFPAFEAGEDESVFRYIDTASSRAGIGALAEKLAIHSVAIIGLGGTGAYIFDHVSKTPVQNIHLFDGDVFSNHNAFRSPGAASLEDLKTRPSKVAYYHALYSKMRRGIHAHSKPIDAKNIERLRKMSFVFICIDNGPARKLIVRKLEEFGIPFIDVGMGVDLAEDDTLFGTLRVTTSTLEMRDHVHSKSRIPFADEELKNLYGSNIQTSDLNCLNACMAVIKWKKLMGFYYDPENEHFSAYTVDGNAIDNDDLAPCPVSALPTAS